jgi:nicotinate-nucleotide adenylyltransferase
MNVALFGGTFDPIHLGHIAVARAAQKRYGLARVYFVPADVPPHKQRRAVTPYHHRYAMIALATQGERDLVPSLLEAPDIEGRAHYVANYSVDTVRRFKSTLKKSDRLFFLIGIDAFLDIASWREPEALLRECEFIVASRPGFSLADVAGALPESMRPSDAVLKPFQKQAATGDIVLGGAAIHLLAGVEEPASATKVREAASHGRAIQHWVNPSVAEYIKKTGLYRSLMPTTTVAANKGRPLGEAKLQVIQGGMKRTRTVAHVRTEAGRPHNEEQ